MLAEGPGDWGAEAKNQKTSLRRTQLTMAIAPIGPSIRQEGPLEI
jgi:hypothetical protein